MTGRFHRRAWCSGNDRYAFIPHCRPRPTPATTRIMRMTPCSTLKQADRAEPLATRDMPYTAGQAFGLISLPLRQTAPAKGTDNPGTQHASRAGTRPAGVAISLFDARSGCSGVLAAKALLVQAAGQAGDGARLAARAGPKEVGDLRASSLAAVDPRSAKSAGS